MKKMFLILFIFIYILFAKDAIIFDDGQDGYYGKVELPSNGDATIDFNYDSTYSDNDDILVNNNEFATIVFNLKAQANEVIVLDYDTSFTLSNDIDTITISNIEADTGSEFTMPSDGEQEIRFKGKMTVSSDISSGSYSSNFTINADYKNPE
jgi:hypothetical protein